MKRKKIMFDLKLKTSVNFDFKKLKDELPKIAKQLVQDSIRESVEATKKSIDNQDHGEPLSDFTKRQRKYGHHPRLKMKRPTTSEVPLRWTDYLYNNIKPIKKGMQMPIYGKYHHYGKTWGGVKRPFIHLAISSKAQKKLQESLKKAFKIKKKLLKEITL